MEAEREEEGGGGGEEEGSKRQQQWAEGEGERKMGGGVA